MGILSKIKIPDALQFVGLGAIAGVLVFSGTGHRVVGFTGLLVAGVGYLWTRLTN